MAYCRNIEIVFVGWIAASASQGAWVATADFDCKHLLFKEDSFPLSETLQNAKNSAAEGGFLANIYLFILAGAVGSGSKKEFASVVDATGAKLLRTRKQLDKAIADKATDSCIVIITSDGKSDTPDLVVEDTIRDGVDFWVEKSTFILGVKHQDRELIMRNSTASKRGIDLNGCHTPPRARKQAAAASKTPSTMEKLANQFSKVNILKSPKASSKPASNSKKISKKDHDKLQLAEEALAKKEELLSKAEKEIQLIGEQSKNNEAKLEQTKRILLEMEMKLSKAVNERDAAFERVQTRDDLLGKLSAVKQSALFRAEQAESQTKKILLEMDEKLSKAKNEHDAALKTVQKKDDLLSQLSAEKQSALSQVQQAESRLVVSYNMHAHIDNENPSLTFLDCFLVS